MENEGHGGRNWSPGYLGADIEGASDESLAAGKFLKQEFNMENDGQDGREWQTCPMGKHAVPQWWGDFCHLCGDRMRSTSVIGVDIGKGESWGVIRVSCPRPSFSPDGYIKHEQSDAPLIVESSDAAK